MFNSLNEITIQGGFKEAPQVSNFAYQLYTIKYLPGHSCMLQMALSVDRPSLEQSFPPWAGAGLLQFLVLVLIPPPQDLLQPPYSFHSLYPPSTEMYKSNFQLLLKHVFKSITCFYYLKLKAFCDIKATVFPFHLFEKQLKQ